MSVVEKFLSSIFNAHTSIALNSYINAYACGCERHSVCNGRSPLQSVKSTQVRLQPPPITYRHKSDNPSMAIVVTPIELARPRIRQNHIAPARRVRST